MAEYTREEVLQMVSEGKSLQGAYLRGINLSSADLRQADLRETNLRKAKLCQANLSKSTLGMADIIKADLSGANLSEATLFRTFLFRANLRKANLNGANLCEANLCGANLCGADLNKASLVGTRLMETDLTGANMRDAELTYTDFDGAILNNSDISGANIYHIKTPGWKIENIKCTHIYCYDPFTTNEEDREKNRKESRREFKEGEFEAIYKSMPTIELWFKDKFSFTDELRLMDIQDRLQREVPDAHISLKKKEWVGRDMVITLAVREADKVKKAAEAAERLYSDKVLEEEFLRRMNEEKAKNILQSIPAIAKALASGTEVGKKTGTTMFVNSPVNITIQTGDGHTAILADSMSNNAIGAGASISIIQNYEDNKTKADELLQKLRTKLTEDRKALVDQFTKALKAKDEGKVKSNWEKMTDGINTTSSLFSIASGIAQLLGL